ncbi:Scytalone dehydratase [Astrocystis sublimbata]|nr:Scytalone dehydratase [Astrocystis sublimbata]
MPVVGSLGRAHVLGCQAALYEWAESYDMKDPVRLAKCIAPTLKINYTSVMGKVWENMPADDLIKMAFDPKFLGNPLLKTQHLVGAIKWVKISNDEMASHQQMRVAHIRYSDSQETTVEAKMHAHGRSTVWYRKVDGTWKFAGLEPDKGWNELDSSLGGKSVFGF